MIAELGSNGSLTRGCVWGLDLSGSMQGAGGVGGLLEVSYHGAQTTNCFVAFDGNGNVSALANAADGTVAAQYEYGPFGELIRATGPMAKVNPFRFSTKYCDDETDLVYYGFRYYNPATGRWLSRDPIGETGFEAPGKGRASALAGGVKLYVFVGNNPVNLNDLNGLNECALGALVEAFHIFLQAKVNKDNKSSLDAAAAKCGPHTSGCCWCCTIAVFYESGENIIKSTDTILSKKSCGDTFPPEWIYPRDESLVYTSVPW
jgi:RHS repeat-associated protein